MYISLEHSVLRIWAIVCDEEASTVAFSPPLAHTRTYSDRVHILHSSTEQGAELWVSSCKTCPACGHEWPTPCIHSASDTMCSPHIIFIVIHKQRLPFIALWHAVMHIQRVAVPTLLQPHHKRTVLTELLSAIASICILVDSPRAVSWNIVLRRE